jgi:hypothetical protein
MSHTLEASDTRWIERRAKLFETGDYPDKGVQVTLDDLTHLAATFAQPVPLLIEHSESPLELGFLKEVEVSGNELLGVIQLTEEANRLVEQSRAKALSLGLSADLKEIREVSLVRNPRVPDAQLFFDEVVFVSELGVEAPPPGGKPTTADYWRKRYLNLRRQTRASEVDEQMKKYVRSGKLVPAQVPFARAMMLADDTVEFNGASRPLRTLLTALLDRAAASPSFSEIVPDSSAEQALLTPEEASFYSRHFPGVSLQQIADAKH